METLNRFAEKVTPYLRDLATSSPAIGTMYYLDPSHENIPADTSRDLLQGTLDLLILRTLAGDTPMHGWGIAQTIKATSRDILQVNQARCIRRCIDSSGRDSSPPRGVRRKTIAAPSSTA